jgi:hypothetical protein
MNDSELFRKTIQQIEQPPKLYKCDMGIQGVKKVPGPLLSPGALDFMPISPSRVIKENHTRQTIIKNSRNDNHKIK